MIISDDKQVVVYNDDYKPVNVFGGRKKIAGWKEEQCTGKHIEVEDTYNDVLDVAVQGHHEQDSRNAVWWNQMISDDKMTQLIVGRSGTFVRSEFGRFRVEENHYYYINLYNTGDIKINAYGLINAADFSVRVNGKVGYSSTIVKSTFTADSTAIWSYEKNGAEYGNVTANVVDLTAMFGEGKEPTAEQFRKMYPCDYYPYCAGEWRYANKGQWVNFNQTCTTDFVRWNTSTSVSKDEDDIITCTFLKDGLNGDATGIVVRNIPIAGKIGDYCLMTAEIIDTSFNYDNVTFYLEGFGANTSFAKKREISI